MDSPFMSKSHSFLLFLSNVLIPLSCLIFASGFFPHKPFIPGIATFAEQNANEEMQLLGDWVGGKFVGKQRPGRVFDRVVFMVVDALRSDFVYSQNSGFDFVQSLIRDGKAWPFTAYAAAPTVTLPRIKALTTGSIPSFADLILNFAESDTTSSLAGQDTWLAQVKAHMHEGSNNTISRPGSIAFLGDDTWLKLFPDFFSFQDGTSSFFVSDFTEVDNNVTRHLPGLMQKPDWDALIMHYLGLDHIGHKTGPEGPNMLSKQHEMDQIIRNIYKQIKSEPRLHNTLLVLAGDHGMNSAGNHGGSGPGETDTAMVFISPKFKHTPEGEVRSGRSCPITPKMGTEFDFYSKIQQSDLVPSLCALLGLPFPKNNLGVLIPDILGMWSEDGTSSIDDPRLQLLYRNALQMLDIVKLQYGKVGFMNVAGGNMKFQKCRYRTSQQGQLQCLWQRAQRMLLASALDGRFPVETQMEALTDFLIEAQGALSTTASSYNLVRLVCGTLLASTAAWLSSLPLLWLRAATFAKTCVATLISLYSVMMFASSYVEEEQHIWYWLTGAWFVVVALAALKHSSAGFKRSKFGFDISQFDLQSISAAILLALHRISIRWNQTGQKYAGDDDIAKSFLSQHRLILWSLIVATFCYYAYRFSKLKLNNNQIASALMDVSAFVVASFTLLFKINFTRLDAPELLLQSALWPSNIQTLTSSINASMVFQLMICALIPIIYYHFSTSKPFQSEAKTSLANQILPLLTLFLIVQSRLVNIPVFLIYAIEQGLIKSLLTTNSTMERSTKAMVVALTTILMAYTSFFQFGGSNAISSIDLSNAYNGISSYNIVAVGVLLFIGNWAGAIWWTVAGIGMLVELTQPDSALLGESRPHQNLSIVSNEEEKVLLNKVPKVLINDALVSETDAAHSVGGDHHTIERTKSAKKREKGRDREKKHASDMSGSMNSDVISPSPELMGTASDGSNELLQTDTTTTNPYKIFLTITTSFTAITLAATMAACTLLRTHLFIWTVFSPKFLYAVAWAVGWHFGIVIILGGTLYILG